MNGYRKITKFANSLVSQVLITLPIRFLSQVVVADKSLDTEQFLKKMLFEGEKELASGACRVKRTDKGGIYFSFPIAVYQLVKGELTTYQVFDRPE